MLSPKDRVISLPNGRYLWLIDMGDPNHLLSGMILQVWEGQGVPLLGAEHVFFLDFLDTQKKKYHGEREREIGEKTEKTQYVYIYIYTYMCGYVYMCIYIYILL